MEKESNKMTAVEWVLQYLNNVKPNEFCSIEKIKELLEQAKEMEKQQMIDFADNYVDNCVLPNENMAILTLMDVPNYYNEQYGGKDGE
jgi:hypothetical protein